MSTLHNIILPVFSYSHSLHNLIKLEKPSVAATTENDHTYAIKSVRLPDYELDDMTTSAQELACMSGECIA